MRIEEVMTRNVRSCGPLDSLNEAAKLMWEGDIGCVPVLDDGQRVLGMLTDRDICMAAYMNGERLEAIVVSSVMSTRVVSCSPHESLSVAEERMRANQVRRLPVVEEDRIVGMLSLNDIALAWQHPPSMLASGLRADEVAETLARISQHRESSNGSVAAAE